jgi:hypothetical protein
MTQSPYSAERPAESVKSFVELGLYPTNGDKVTVVGLYSTDGMSVAQSFLDARKFATGITLGSVPGPDNDILFVQHLDETQAAHCIATYCIDELAPATDSEV